MTNIQEQLPKGYTYLGKGIENGPLTGDHALLCVGSIGSDWLTYNNENGWEKWSVLRAPAFNSSGLHYAIKTTVYNQILGKEYEGMLI